MTTGIKDSLGIHANALVLRSARNSLLASNIANAATPGFQARDFDFESVLAQQTGGGPMRVNDARHMTNLGSATNEPGYRIPVMPSMDNNTVDLAVEQLEFSENTVRYQTTLELLNRRISGLMQAIRGE